MNALEQFESDHALGAMKLSASLWPCLVLPPEHRPGWMRREVSPHSYGMHVRGDLPLSKIDPKNARRGRYMERMAAGLLLEDQGIEVETPDAEIGRLRRERLDIPAVCNLDAKLMRPNWAAEVKSVRTHAYREAWADGPPWYPRVQAHCQMAIDRSLEGVLIVPVVLDYSDYPSIPAVYEEPRDEVIGNMLVETGRAFIEMLRRGELPPPDETVASYDAIMRTLKLEAGETVTLPDDADAQQFLWWQQAKHQEKAGREQQEAAKRYFAVRGGNASVIELPGIGRIERTHVPVKAEDQPRPARTNVRWLLKEPL